MQRGKNLPVLLWGPLFVGTPVRPNMLNMPKSASEYKLMLGLRHGTRRLLSTEHLSLL